MSNKHTPGPWTITVYPPDDDGAEDLCAYIDGNGTHVSHCMPPDGANKELRDANARLIAVAPELLEAVIELKDVCNRPSAARTRAEAWRKLDKAIAKATGGAGIDAMEKYGHAAKITVKKLEGV